MARALADIMTELSSVYNPQRTAANEQYNLGIGAVDPQQQADLAGLEAAKKDSFGQIEQGANRRGMFYSGVPIAEQSKYVGQNYLPAVANLSNRYAQIRGNLRQSLADTLANLDVKQREFGQGIYQNEVNQDIQRQANADANTRATASNAPFQITPPTPTPNNQAVLGDTTTLRDTWQSEANKGDGNAQVALNYAGNDGRYDGAVNSVSEYNILKQMGIQGDYYVAYGIPANSGLSQPSSGTQGLSFGGNTNTNPVSLNRY